MRWPTRIPPFWLQATAGAVFAVLFILWGRGTWVADADKSLVSNIASTLVPAGAAGACFYRAHRVSGTLRRAWRLLGAGVVSWTLGQTAWTVIQFQTGAPPPSPSLADVGYLGFIPLAAWGITLFVQRDRATSGYLRMVLDGAIMGSSFMFIVFVAGLEKLLLASSRSNALLITDLLYPFGDAIIFSLVLARLARAGPHARRTLGFLAAGIVALVIADMWFLVVDSEGVYATGGILDAFWIIGFQLIELAAIHPKGFDGQFEAPRQSFTLAALPLLPFVIAMVAAVAAEVRDGFFSDTLFWTALVVVALVVARLMAMLLDNMRLTRTAESALESNRQAQVQRTQLLNNVTHDLLSPLSPVLIQLKILERPDLALPEKATHSLDIIRRNVVQVKRLGEDLKDLANLEAGKFKVDRVPLDLGLLVAQAAESFLEAGKDAGVQVQMAPAASLPVLGDKGRLNEVLYNLLSNAIRFTPDGGAVQIRAAQRGAVARIEVQDTGRGLGAEEIPRLFKPFSQVHDRSEAKEKGTGLGLYVSRNIVEQHGGHIGVDSLGKGHGSTFWVEVPLANAGAGPATMPPAPRPQVGGSPSPAPDSPSEA